MKPKDPAREAKPVKRAALYLGANDVDGATLVYTDGAHTFGGRAALLDYLIAAQSFKPFSQLWLVPDSPADWRVLVPTLLGAGYRLSASARRGTVSSLRIYLPESSEDELGEDSPSAVYWHGRSAAGLVHVAAGLTPEEQCAATLAEIDVMDDALRRRFPAITIGSSLTGTALEIFRLFLTQPLDVDPQVEVSLRRAGAVGGGRQELFVLPGTSVRRTGYVDPDADGKVFSDTPVDVDLSGAYPTALDKVPIGVELLGPGTESQYADPCTVSVALVRVPTMLYAPLRYEPGNEEGSSCYPTGVVWGAWSNRQLLAAEAVGATILKVEEVWRFKPTDVFQRFGETLRRWRAEADTPAEAELVKQIGVRAVGAFLMSPRASRLICSLDPDPQDLDGALSMGHGIYEVAIAERQHDNALLPAGIQTIGAVQAWMALLLHGAEKHRAMPIYCHTDGGAFRSERGAVAAIEWAAEHGGPPVDASWDVVVGDVVPEGLLVGDPTGSSQAGGSPPPPPGPFAGPASSERVQPAEQTYAKQIARPYRMGPWKVVPLDKITVWAPGQRHEIRSTGERKTAGAGISRELTETEILARVASAEHLAELDRRGAGRRIWEQDAAGGFDRAPRVDEVDPDAASKLEGLALRVETQVPTPSKEVA